MGHITKYLLEKNSFPKYGVIKDLLTVRKGLKIVSI